MFKKKIKNKKFFLIFFCFLFLLTSFFVFLFFLISEFRSVDKITFNDGSIVSSKIKNKEINVELAVSFDKQYLGLSHRESIPNDFGMLFLFPEKDIRSFVMRDMKFNLDIVFIDENEIVEIYKNLSFDQFSQNIYYKSVVPVDKVLELRGGFCDEYKISIGDKFYLNKD